MALLEMKNGRMSPKTRHTTIMAINNPTTETGTKTSHRNRLSLALAIRGNGGNKPRDKAIL